ncbi:hypothetical protein MKL09_26655 [Methylobacterium sp. J-048]|uniref:hypothetical protein n=1 Tax=unclassified Methylobacterium TaxID=2615210 RepID=UPI001FB8FB07|nr:MULTISPECIES: hypothetical protein [unclassified Methylobacterium]MCJ2060099.1 hypothetical protein [Methylobacterium sp. J-048]MCJ2093257.1 hypothetical protein [Methylobacterium sp. J-072]
MISVSSNNYFAVVRAAENEAIRTGSPMDGKQSVAVAVDKTEPPPAPPVTDASATGRVVNVMV